MGARPISKLQIEPGEQGRRHKRGGGELSRAQAGSWDISLKVWDSLDMISCCPAEEEAEGQTYLEATSDHFGRDRIDKCDMKLNSIYQGGKSEALSSQSYNKGCFRGCWLGALSSTLGSNSKVN